MHVVRAMNLHQVNGSCLSHDIVMAYKSFFARSISVTKHGYGKFITKFSRNAFTLCMTSGYTLEGKPYLLMIMHLSVGTSSLTLPTVILVSVKKI